MGEISSTEHQENVTMSDVAPETSANGAASNATDGAATASTAPAAEQAATENDPWEPYRKMMRSKESVQARVVKWQRNGLEVELEGGTRAFMPNDMIDRDPNRNVANYFGKSVPVKVTSVKMQPGLKAADITVSHRAVLDEEYRNAGKERIQELNQGDVVEVKVKAFSKDNVVVDLGPGIDAVIRLRDLSWQRVEHPYEVAKRGDTLKAKIMSVDRGRRRVQLGVKQLTEDPELAKYSEFSVDQTVTGKVISTGQYGAEVELSNGLVAFLPMSEIDWKRINAVTDVLNIGDEVETKILTITPDDRRVTLSRKQLIENPMRKIEATYKLGSDHNGVIKEVNRGGVVVELEHGAEGFVPRRELSHDRIERLEDVFKAGKPMEGLRVIEYDRRGGKITMSLIAAEKEAQRNTLKNYRASSKASTFTLGDSLAALKAQLEQQEKGK